jgi:hypothetical protein
MAPFLRDEKILATGVIAVGQEQDTGPPQAGVCPFCVEKDRLSYLVVPGDLAGLRNPEAQKGPLPVLC